MSIDNSRITCGVDIDSRYIEVVLLQDNRMVTSLIENTGTSPSENAETAFREASAQAGMLRPYSLDRINHREGILEK